MIGVPSFRRDFGHEVLKDGKLDYILPASWQTAFNTVSSVGQFFGGFICSDIADRIGRKKSLAIGLVIVTGGIFGEMFSVTRTAFVVSKLILGVGLGFYLSIAPMASSEISPLVFRAIATAGVQFGIGSGQLLSNAAIKGFGEGKTRWAYRGPFAIQLFFCVFLAIFLPFAPEPPSYLARVGKREQAKKSLIRLYGKNVDVDAKLVALEASISEEEAMKTKQGTYKQCFSGTDRIRTLISMGVFVCQHFVGIIFVLGFSTYFFQLAQPDISIGTTFSLGLGVTACGLAGNILSWFTVNRFGRRPLFIIGIATLTVILLLMGILDVIPTKGARWVQAAITLFYAFVYFASLGAGAFVLLGETSSSTMRAPSVALATATQAVMGIIFNFATPYMLNPDEGNLEGKVGFVFGGLGALATVWSYFYIPELKGRTFAEIDIMFQNKVSPRQMGSYQVPSY